MPAHIRPPLTRHHPARSAGGRRGAAETGALRKSCWVYRTRHCPVKSSFAIAGAPPRLASSRGVSKQLLGKILNGDGGQGHNLHRAARSEFYRDACDRLVVGGLHDADKIIGAQYRILTDHPNSHPFYFSIDLLDTVWPFLDGLASFIGEGAHQHVGWHDWILPYTWITRLDGE